MGHGNHWETIFQNVEDVMKLLPEIVQKGKVVERLTAKDVQLLEVGEYAAIQLPNDQPLSCLAVIRKAVESNEFVSCYPAINDGEENILEIQTINSKEPEDGEFEGIITATDSLGIEMTFFEPRFPINKSTLFGRMIFKLGAIAYNIEPTRTEFDIDAGPLLELERERIAEEGGDPAGVQSVKVFAGELRCCIPHGHGDFEFQSVVEDVQTFSFLGMTIYRLKILLGPKEENPGAIALFASEKAAGGMIPKVGDAIMGVAWLQGIAVGSIS